MSLLKYFRKKKVLIFKQLNIGWNADPNAPEIQLSLNNNCVNLDFYLNYFMFDKFKEDDKGHLSFINCHKYSLNFMNDEGYHRGQYRYKDIFLPWGEFYLIETDWKNDFPKDAIILNNLSNKRDMNHYIFFFKDNTFECVAEKFEITFNRY